MTNRIKRLRIFAGPNGSGKSTLYDYLVKTHVFNSYFHINPDFIARDLPVSFNLDNWPIPVTENEMGDFLDASPFQALVPFRLSETIVLHNSAIVLKDRAFRDISYLAAALADFLRNKMLESDSSFSFESVFSHPSKIDEIEAAKKAGYKTYLYFIATSDPLINLQRVQNRVECGGHDVPEAKVRERYYRTMDNCYKAFLLADRVFFFDNSTLNLSGSYEFFAEKTGGKLHIVSPQTAPQWFGEYVLKKMQLDERV
ncbi:hypothetical protein FACS1894141_5030 [Spirochaetia bacterium]|nr:hypothetical protein FACS1894141_5030 [Spirochaetia bacterium]